MSAVHGGYSFHTACVVGAREFIMRMPRFGAAAGSKHAAKGQAELMGDVQACKVGPLLLGAPASRGRCAANRWQALRLRLPPRDKRRTALSRLIYLLQEKEKAPKWLQSYVCSRRRRLRSYV